MSKLETLLKKDAWGFLNELVAQAAEVDAALLKEKNPEDNATAEDIIDDLGGTIGFIEESINSIQADGYSLREVYSKGGGEGGGESVIRIWAVIQGATRKKRTKDDIEWGIPASLNNDGEVVAHIRVRGFYESYNGTEWDDGAEFVFPQEVTVTKYFNKAELKKVKK